MAGRWRMSTIGDRHGRHARRHLLGRRASPSRPGGPAVSIGTLVAFVSLQQGLFRPAVSLLSTGVQIQTSLALFQRIFEYLDLPIDITEPDRAGPARRRSRGEVRFEDVDFDYDAQDTAAPQRILDGIDLDRPRGRQPRRRRPDRLRQVHAQLSGAPAVRRDRRPGHPRRGRRARPRLRHPRPRGRRRLPGDVPLPRLGRRQPALRQAGRHRRGDRRGGARRPRSTTTSPPCPTATTPSSASAATASPAARSSGWPSPARSCATRPSSSSTRRPAPWTPAPSTPCRRPSTRLSAGRTTITIAHRLSTVRDADQIVVLDCGPDRRARHPRGTARRGTGATRPWCGGTPSCRPSSPPRRPRDAVVGRQENSARTASVCSPSAGTGRSAA